MEPSLQDARVRAAWAADRSYLLAIATGMLGRSAEAEEVVQEAFARLVAGLVDEIDDLRGWLVVVTRRLCLNRLGSAETKRTTPTSDLPEIGQAMIDPADRLTLDDEVRRALAVVIDRLSPTERTSFILHDVFGFPFDAIAELVGRTPAACRQLARRARQSIRASSFDTMPPATEPRPVAVADLAQRFIAVCEGGDVQGLIELLDPKVDGAATVMGRPPLQPVSGAKTVAGRAMRFFGPAADVWLEPFALEGRPGVVARRGGQVVAVVRLDGRGGRILHVHAVARPFRRGSR